MASAMRPLPNRPSKFLLPRWRDDALCQCVPECTAYRLCDHNGVLDCGGDGVEHRPAICSGLQWCLSNASPAPSPHRHHAITQTLPLSCFTYLVGSPMPIAPNLSADSRITTIQPPSYRSQRHSSFLHFFYPISFFL